MRASIRHDIEERVRELPEVDESTSDAADAVVEEARARAPKVTGAGAASIHKERLNAPASWGVSWDDAHDYMRFPEFGTERMKAVAFLRAAAEAPSRNQNTEQ